MESIILVVYLIVSIALIGIILLQQGKGAEMGASFGAGGANTVFGAAGSGNVLTKTTTILAILFFAIALSISYFNSAPASSVDEVLDEVSAPVVTPQPSSIEAELPTATQGGIEAEVAPAQKASIEAETPAASEAAKAETEEKTENAKKEGDN
ncbi:preprotein translocase subunit SecG [Aliikangiella marina]|uniref:Protein-export membrane protein SecG n=1 Tax=Aliikangiella marina TaxID=1712262 RepID=A0A545TBU0_9GAMM|nr:preprotein translocase subunit SecG [Aliikangiella marina]